MRSHQHDTAKQEDLAILNGELSAVEQTRRTDLQSESEEQFDAYRVAHAKAELMAEFCREHPELTAQVMGEMDAMRAAFGGDEER